MTDAPANNRSSPRSRAFKGGIILFPNGISTFVCRIKDISETGMQISVENASGIPDAFTLIMEEDKRRIPCNVMWRKGNKFGVKFVAALEDRRHHGDWAMDVSPEDMALIRARQALRAKAEEMKAALQPKLASTSKILKRPIAV
jgi:PilZ domain